MPGQSPQRRFQWIDHPYLLYLEKRLSTTSEALQMAANVQNRASHRPQGRLIGYSRPPINGFRWSGACDPTTPGTTSRVSFRQRGLDWTPERLRRAVKWMVSEGMVDKSLLRKSPPRPPEDRLMTLVTGIHFSNPELTLREIANQLERLHERTPRGGYEMGAILRKEPHRPGKAKRFGQRGLNARPNDRGARTRYRSRGSIVDREGQTNRKLPSAQKCAQWAIERTRSILTDQGSDLATAVRAGDEDRMSEAAIALGQAILDTLLGAFDGLIDDDRD